MSILIKGMEMPTSCSKCPMLEGDRLDGLCHAASRWLDDDEYWTWYAYPEGDIDDSKPCNCPLVPVPKHGRLIDADKLKEEFPHDEDWDYPVNTNSYVVETIDKSPTIIETEEDE